MKLKHLICLVSVAFAFAVPPKVLAGRDNKYLTANGQRSSLIRFTYRDGAVTPLASAIYKKNEIGFRRWVQAGEDINEKYSDGCTPIFDAVERECYGIVNFLIQSGARINVANKWGETPLHWAATLENTDMAEYLVEIEDETNKANVNAQDGNGATPLHWAVRANNASMVSYLLVLGGAKPNLSDHWGNTPLHFAAEVGNLKIIDDLVRFGGGNVCAKNKMGDTPIDFAKRAGKPEVAKYLQKLKKRRVGEYLGGYVELVD